MGREREFRDAVSEWFWKNYIRGRPDSGSRERLDASLNRSIDEKVQVYLNLKILDILKVRGHGHWGKSERVKLYRALREVVGGKREGIILSAIKNLRSAFDDLLEVAQIRADDSPNESVEAAIDTVSTSALDKLDLEIEAAVDRIAAP